jgi:hypothetical protein
MLTINIPIWLAIYAMGLMTGFCLLLALGFWMNKRQKPKAYTVEQVHDAFARWCGLGSEFELYTDEWWEVFETQLMGSTEVTR